MTNTDVRIPAIEEFLAGWKIRANEWFKTACNRGYELGAKVDALEKAYKEANAIPEWHSLRNAPTDEIRYARHDYNYYWHDTLPNYLYQFKWHFDQEEADKILNRAVKQKRETLIARTEKLIGKIVDVAYLNIGATGELEGFIIGENGKVKIETIGAGGYNIQCYHFRVLIHLVKEKAAK